MAEGGAIIGLSEWLSTAPGRYLLAWEQSHLDTAVADLFGFHALQLGLPELDALRANRMPHRWVGMEAPPVERPAPWHAPSLASSALDGSAVGPAAIALHCDFDALPFDASSLDLIVLPHALELARDPHQTLREVERVLVPEGRVVIVGFNPTSLWGARQRVDRARQRLARGAPRDLFLPGAGGFIGHRRLRDWLRLLSFELEAGRYGCYRPPVGSEHWLTRFDWMDRVGERWWPVFGAVYFVVAVKRVRGMRLVGLARSQQAARQAAKVPAVAVQQHRDDDGAPTCAAPASAPSVRRGPC